MTYQWNCSRQTGPRNTNEKRINRILGGTILYFVNSISQLRIDPSENRVVCLEDSCDRVAIPILINL